MLISQFCGLFNYCAWRFIMTTAIASPGVRVAQRTAPAVFGSDGSKAAADRILAHTSHPRQPKNIALMAGILKELVKTHPQLARNAYANLNSKLIPTQQGELQRLVGNSLANPQATRQRLNTGQHVLRGTGMASDVLHGAAAIGVESRAVRRLAPLPARIAFMTVDAKMKYDELRAMGFSHGAANAGMLAGQAASAGASGAGSIAGGWAGGIATSWSGPGAIVGAGGGAVIGGAIGGGIDWAFGLSDKAALAAANHFDGRNIR
jgi:hypothetical protein